MDGCAYPFLKWMLDLLICVSKTSHRLRSSHVNTWQTPLFQHPDNYRLPHKTSRRSGSFIDSAFRNYIAKLDYTGCARTSKVFSSKKIVYCLSEDIPPKMVSNGLMTPFLLAWGTCWIKIKLLVIWDAMVLTWRHANHRTIRNIVAAGIGCIVTLM